MFRSQSFRYHHLLLLLLLLMLLLLLLLLLQSLNMKSHCRRLPIECVI